MEENKTLECLDNISRLITIWSQEDYDLDKMDALLKLKQAIIDAHDDKIISKQMYNDYAELFENNQAGIGLSDENLQNVVNRHLQMVENADEEMTKSLRLPENMDENVADSRDALDQINADMEKYLNQYDPNMGELSVVDEFCALAQTIQAVAEKGKISKTTAERLMDPLQDIKKDMCNPDTHNRAMAEFQQILAEKLQRENENQGQTQNNENTFGDAMKSLRSLGNSAVNGIKTLNKKLDERAREKADEKEKQQKETNKDKFADFRATGLEKKQEAKDVSQKPDDQMAREDKAQDKKEPKAQEDALERIINLVNKYEDVYREKGSILEPEVGEVWEELTDGINYAVNNNLISDDMANQLVDAHDFLRSHGLNSDRQFEGIGKFKEIIGDKSDKKESVGKEQVVQKEPESKQTTQQETHTIHITDAMHTTGLEKKQEAKDAPERPEIKSEDLRMREDKQKSEEKENLKQDRPLPTPNQARAQEEKSKSDETQHKIAEVRKGIQKVVEMGQEREIQKSQGNEIDRDAISREAKRRQDLLQNGAKSDKDNEIALAVKRRQMLLGRK